MEHNLEQKPPPRKNFWNQFHWLPLLSLVILLIAWEAIVQVSGLPSFILPTPAQVWARFFQALARDRLIYHTASTLLEIVLGLSAGLIVATVLGYLVAKSRLMERLLSPFIVASQAVPIVAIAPLLVIWFGRGLASKVLICALIVFFPVLINTVVGVRAVPRSLYELMRSLRATRGQIFRQLEIPSTLPIFLGGLRIGATLSVIGAVVGELSGADRGLGSLLYIARTSYDAPLVFVAVFALVILAITLYAIVTWLEKRLLKWQENQ
jgi:NitT/TauT family transport system permease protein